MTPDFLNINQTAEEVNDNYGEKDYYWYLRSPEFRKAFLEPLGKTVDYYGKSCLDVGCGEGQLADYVTCRYTGFDASREAIQRGLKRNPKLNLFVSRLEDPPPLPNYDVIVFGGILSVIIKPQYRVELVRNYIKYYEAKYAIVYDLENLDASSLNVHFQRLEERHMKSDPLPIDPVKLTRKILVYRVV
jgi:SAM-dependent methyltransferase